MSQRSYTTEFKDQACELVFKEGYAIVQAARKLGIPPQTLHRWVSDRRRTGQDVPDSNDPKVLKAQVRELEARLRRSEMERDILKKATAYFARENP